MPLQSHVQIGIVGKPNVGKSTFFAAATMIDVKIAPYPFTTIEPNVGVGYVRIPASAGTWVLRITRGTQYALMVIGSYQWSS